MTYSDPKVTYIDTVTSALRKRAETSDYRVSSQKAAQTIRILMKIIKNSVICELFNSDDSVLQRAGEISAWQNVLLQSPPAPLSTGLLYPKLWVQTVGIATLLTGVSDFCNYDTAIIPHFLCILLNVCPG